MDNVTPISTGMGQVEDENTLKARLSEDSVSFELKYLTGSCDKKLEDYTAEYLKGYNNPKNPKLSLKQQLFLPLHSKYFKEDIIVVLGVVVFVQIFYRVFVIIRRKRTT